MYEDNIDLNLFYRLVSAYEDKALGLTELGQTFQMVKNKTFPEFINLVLRQWTRRRGSCNEHWRPYYMHCDYCHIKYDMIGYLESMEPDLKYLAYRSNITLPLNKGDSRYHNHPSGRHRYFPPNKISQEEKDKKVISYFSQLNATQLINLYNMYRIDFEMFGYSVRPFVKAFNRL